MRQLSSKLNFSRRPTAPTLLLSSLVTVLLLPMVTVLLLVGLLPMVTVLLLPMVTILLLPMVARPLPLLLLGLHAVLLR
jgi:hypothetical protein